MNALKCPHCGFVGFAEADCCKRCGQSPGSPITAGAQQADGSAERNLRTFLKIVGVLAVLAVIIAGVVIAREVLKPDPNLAYIEAINKSSELKGQVSVRMNQKELRPEFDYVTPLNLRKVGYAVKAGEVLEALDLITMTTETTTNTSESDQTIYDPDTGRSVPLSTLTVKHTELVIRLTEKGRQESANWLETAEPVRTAQGIVPASSTKVSWWRIPIGETQFTRIDKVVKTGEAIVDIDFLWRWQPNQLGESFDYAGTAINRLPEPARNAVASIGWNSQMEYPGHARLRRSGDVWEVTQITLSVPNKQD